MGGNAFGAPTANIGNTDNNNFAIIVNNTQVVFVTTASTVGIGTDAPAQTFHVVGSTRIEEKLENGSGVEATGDFSHAEGVNTEASGEASHAEGQNTEAIGDSSHAEGNGSEASDDYAHAEGEFTFATGRASHSEGDESEASGTYAHAEGESTEAVGEASHAEGNSTTSTADYSHAEGTDTETLGDFSHSEGDSTVAEGQSSHAEGLGTIASGDYQHVSGRYNVGGNTTALAIIGNGTDDSNRSNLVEFYSDSILVNQSLIITESLDVSGSVNFQDDFQLRISQSLFVIQNVVGGGTVEITPEGEIRADAISSPNITAVNMSPNYLAATDLNGVLVDASPSFVYAVTASNSVSSSYSGTASILLGSVTSASYAGTASVLLGSVISSSYAGTASVVLGAITSASYALSASHADTADNVFVQGGNAFSQTGSLGTTDENNLNIISNRTATLIISGSSSGSLGTGSVGINVAPQSAIDLAVGGLGRIGLMTASPRIVTQQDTASVLKISGGPGLTNGARIELSGDGAVLAIGTLAASGSLYMTTKNTGCYVFQHAPLTGSIAGAVTRVIIRESGLVGIGGHVNPTASVDIMGTVSHSLLQCRSTDSASVLYVSGSGRIGIGTSTPQATLDVVGNISASQGITSSFIGTNNNTNFVLVSNTSQSLYVNTNGRISIGTASAERTLHVVGNGIISERAGSPQLVLRRTSPLLDWQFSVGSTSFQFSNISASITTSPITIETQAPDNSLFIRSDGSVGMGTSQPQTTLHVSGTISSSVYTGKVVGTLTTLTAATTMSIDFNASMFHSASLSSSVYLTGSNPGVGKMASLKISASAGINVYYPPSWIWLGTAPTFISSSKTAVISLTCYGNTDGDFIGAYATQL